MKAARESMSLLTMRRRRGKADQRLKLSGIRIAAGQYSEADQMSQCAAQRSCCGTRTEDILPKGGVPMGLSVFPYICISNNPDLVNSVNQLEIVDGTALAVLTRGRDLIHLGWELVANPLYGNFKPNQQPYRTIVLKKNNSTDLAATHFDSLNLIEAAINIYRSSHILRIPGELRERIDKDFRYLDFSLMEETFCQCELLCSVLQRTTTGEVSCGIDG